MAGLKISPLGKASKNLTEPKSARFARTETERRSEPGTGLGAQSQRFEWLGQSSLKTRLFPRRDGRLSVLATGGGGETGIRTLGGVAPTTVFETAPFDRSGTSPRSRAAIYGVRNGSASLPRAGMASREVWLDGSTARGEGEWRGWEFRQVAADPTEWPIGFTRSPVGAALLPPFIALAGICMPGPTLEL